MAPSQSKNATISTSLLAHNIDYFNNELLLTSILYNDLIIMRGYKNNTGQVLVVLVVAVVVT
jgi:hypothetical protein